ncbi:hypothetical protein CHU98_g8665 [Xylaria longipes]|nr:hypothetical protein CHU98_g8665 [Xylaria longipes]
MYYRSEQFFITQARGALSGFRSEVVPNCVGYGDSYISGIPVGRHCRSKIGNTRPPKQPNIAQHYTKRQSARIGGDMLSLDHRVTLMFGLSKHLALLTADFIILEILLPSHMVAIVRTQVKNASVTICESSTPSREISAARRTAAKTWTKPKIVVNRVEYWLLLETLHRSGCT